MKAKIFFKACVSVDMAKAKFNVCMATMDEGQNIHFLLNSEYSNDHNGYEKFLKDVKRMLAGNKFQVVMEATGSYHEPLAFWLDKQGIAVVIELPTKMKKYMGSLNLKSKTDKIDAKAIARYGLERKLENWEPPRPDLLQLRELRREIYQLNKNKTTSRNRIEAIKHGHFTDEVRRLARLTEQIELYERQIKETEDEIKELLSQYPELKKSVDIVSSITGVGEPTACTLIGETFEFRDIHTRNQLVSFAGYDVVYRESGSSVNGAKRISKRGNKYIRAAMYFPAMTAITNDERFKAIADRIKQKTGFYGKANVAVQRRLLVLSYHLVKKRTKFNKDIHLQKNRETQGLPALDAPFTGAL